MEIIQTFLRIVITERQSECVACDKKNRTLTPIHFMNCTFNVQKTFQGALKHKQQDGEP